VYRGLFSWG